MPKMKPRTKKMVETYTKLVSEGWQIVEEWPGKRIYMERGLRRVAILQNGSVKES